MKFNPYVILLFMINRPTLKTPLLIVISFLSFLLPDLVYAQDKNVYEITEDTSLQTKNRQDFYNLAFNLNTTVYLKNNGVQTTYGDGSIIKITIQDTKSFDILKSNQTQYNQAELITIKVSSLNELRNTVDLTTLTAMKSLKYVFIKCSFKCQLKDIINFITANSSVRVFYNAETPS